MQATGTAPALPGTPAPSAAAAVRPRIRVVCDGEIALGPGKVALLAAVARHGCLAAAARELGMSYMRAWKLIRTMNACFRAPLVVTRRGGKEHGSALLSDTGQRVLALYLRMEQDSLAAMAGAWEELRTHLA